MSVTEAAVIEALRPVEDPELHRSIVDLDMVRRVGIDGATVDVLIALTVAGCPLRAEIQNRVTTAVTASSLSPRTPASSMPPRKQRATILPSGTR